jgi:steroid delta-isomerase-like uncharacterized protein
MALAYWAALRRQTGAVHLTQVAKESVMPFMDNKATLLRAIAAFNNVNDREGYFQLYAERAVLHRSPPLAPGIEAIKQWYKLLWNAFPDSQLTLGNVIGDGEFVANNFRLKGTHRGPFLGIPATGKPIDVEGVTILRFNDGKCEERWSQTDVFGIMRQVGGIS